MAPAATSLSASPRWVLTVTPPRRHLVAPTPTRIFSCNSGGRGGPHIPRNNVAEWQDVSCEKCLVEIHPPTENLSFCWNGLVWYVEQKNMFFNGTLRIQSPSENGFMELKYFAFRRWFFTPQPLILWQQGEPGSQTGGGILWRFGISSFGIFRSQKAGETLSRIHNYTPGPGLWDLGMHN